jgi:hypothetical protein
MFEVGKTYETKKGTQETCIAVTDTFAFMQSCQTGTPYTWTHDGKSYSLGSSYDIIMPAREFWIYEGMVTDVYHANAIHVREVLPEC